MPARDLDFHGMDERIFSIHLVLTMAHQNLGEVKLWNITISMENSLLITMDFP